MSISIAGKPIGPIGLGMGGFIHPSKQTSVEDAIATMKAALDAGANFWNAGEMYGLPTFNSLHLLNAYFTKYPEDAEKVVVSVKGCFNMRAGKAYNDPQGVRESIGHALKVLDGKCRIDVFETARGDPTVPIEVTVGAIAEFVDTKQIGGIGLSECSAASIRKASHVHPIAAVEIELSLFDTDIFDNGVAEACRELEIPIVAYSPLGKGFLTGQLRKVEDLPEHDYRRMFFPRFQPDVFDDNLKLVDIVDGIAKRKGCTTAQLAIAWVAAQSHKVGVPVIPIPGTSSVSRVQENMQKVQLSRDELHELNNEVEKVEVKGGRAPARFAHFLEV